MIPIRSEGYGYLFLLGLPFAVAIPMFAEPSVLAALPIAIVIVIESIVWTYCTPPRVSFPKSLGWLVQPYMSGCANITILYIWAPLAYHFVVAAVCTYHGLRNGRPEAQRRWVKHLGFSSKTVPANE